MPVRIEIEGSTVSDCLRQVDTIGTRDLPLEPVESVEDLKPAGPEWKFAKEGEETINPYTVSVDSNGEFWMWGSIIPADHKCLIIDPTP